MPLNIDQLPFDVLFNIVSYISLEDVVHLGLVCRQLRQLLIYENTLCRRTVEGHARFTKEAKSATEGKISYREALLSVHARRKAYAAARPDAACILGHGSSFLYRQGVLCYMSQDSILIRNVHGDARDGKIRLSYVLSPSFGPGSPYENHQPEISLLHYSDGIVSLHYDYTDELDHSFLIIIDLRQWHQGTGAALSIKRLTSASKLFVRNTAQYLYYGTHTGTGSHGHHEWKIRGIALSPDCPLPPNIPALQLEEFVGSDIGSTVAFEIHDGYFHAISNQTSFDVEEVDWTSFYHCIRFPVERPVREACEINTSVYRRQHKEGPINDSWTDLGLQVDEATNALKIVEARREWLLGRSKQLRTFYTRDIPFGPERAVSVGSDDSASQSASPIPSRSPVRSPVDLDPVMLDLLELETGADGSTSTSPPIVPLLPLDDPLARTIGSGNNPHYAPERPRYFRHTHHEFAHPGHATSPQFILSRTKLRTYSLSCSAFLDLVEDENCCAHAGIGVPCLRLRIGARRPMPLTPIPQPMLMEEKGKGKAGNEADESASNNNNDQSADCPVNYEALLTNADRLNSLDDFLYSPIHLWPPPCSAPDPLASGESDCSSLLHRILNAPLPTTTASTSSWAYAPPVSIEIVAAADERSVVFLRKPRYGSGNGPICLISFDGRIRVTGLANTPQNSGMGGRYRQEKGTHTVGQDQGRKDSAVGGLEQKNESVPFWKGCRCAQRSVNCGYTEI